MLGLSARAHHRVLKLARTTADLGNQPDIQPLQVSEALSLRKLDRAEAKVGSTQAPSGP